MSNRQYLNEIIYNMEKKILGVITPKELKVGTVYRVYLIDHIMNDDIKELQLKYIEERSTRNYGTSLSQYSIFKAVDKTKYKHKLLNSNYKITWYCVRKSVS